jgi:hypothetical protein
VYHKLQVATSEPSDRLRLGAAEAPIGPTASGLSKGIVFPSDGYA